MLYESTTSGLQRVFSQRLEELQPKGRGGKKKKTLFHHSDNDIDMAKERKWVVRFSLVSCSNANTRNHNPETNAQHCNRREQWRATTVQAAAEAAAAKRESCDRESEKRERRGSLSFTDTHHIFPYPRSLCFSFVDLTDENTRDRTRPGKMAFSAVYQLTAAIYQETHDGHD
jgi:hypothetical protein